MFKVYYLENKTLKYINFSYIYHKITHNQLEIQYQCFMLTTFSLSHSFFFFKLRVGKKQIWGEKHKN